MCPEKGMAHGLLKQLSWRSPTPKNFHWSLSTGKLFAPQLFKNLCSEPNCWETNIVKIGDAYHHSQVQGSGRHSSLAPLFAISFPRKCTLHRIHGSKVPTTIQFWSAKSLKNVPRISQAHQFCQKTIISTHGIADSRFINSSLDPWTKSQPHISQTSW